jgi:hypothetical protein
VEVRQGQWNHQDWLDLLAELAQTLPGPLVPVQVGLILEEARREWLNLRRWQASGAARRWVEAHGGAWDEEDWLALLRRLAASGFWPLNPEAVKEALERCRQEYINLRRWRESGAAAAWVREHQGQWNHADWLALLESLSLSEFWPLAPDQVGQALEEARRCERNLRRWQESGEPGEWLERHGGGWSGSAWLELLAELRESAYWPMEPDAAEDWLRSEAEKHRNLRRWEESGEALRWLERHGPAWDDTDWLSLLGEFQWSGLWPIDPEAAAATLERLRRESHGPADPPRTLRLAWGTEGELPLLEPRPWFDDRRPRLLPIRPLRRAA